MVKKFVRLRQAQSDIEKINLEYRSFYGSVKNKWNKSKRRRRNDNS